MRRISSLCFMFIFIGSLAFADVATKNPIVQDEGTTVAGGGRILNFTGAGVAATYSGGKYVITIGSGGGGAPTDADYLVGTANGELSAEIVVGTTPGGSLGGTWASPTIDDLFLLNTGDIGTGDYDFGGATLEIPNGADPDLTIEGQISWDTDDDWLRAIDANAGNQVIVGQKAKVIAFTVCNPDLLTDADFVPIWTNQTGATFNITAIYSFSDVDDADYTLKYTTNATYDFTNLTTIEAITISTNGTGVYYNEKAVGDIDDTTVETGKTIGFDASADDVDYIHGVIVGYLDANVN